jgi:hypothetical protein
VGSLGAPLPLLMLVQPPGLTAKSQKVGCTWLATSSPQFAAALQSGAK